VREDGEEVRTFTVHAPKHQSGTDVALIPEEVRLE
jgi:hypothetical protein